MGVIRTIAVVILSISFVVFVALFGRLPAFRRTPVAFLHRLLLKHIPNAFGVLDERLTGRRVSRSLARTGDYLMNEKHPLVLVFFLLLQIIGEVLFIPASWDRLGVSQKIVIPCLVAAPLWFLYLSATTSSNITPANHAACMRIYPYDFALFHPGYFCSTCHFAKPARSKHCGICKACVQKQDHHCIWINNCVGRNNYIWFILLLVSIAMLLAYGTQLGYVLLDGRLQERFVPAALTRGSLTAKRWSTKMGWGEFWHCWAWAISVEWRIGAVMMLAFMSFPLAVGFLVYHVYLIWAGMTTNESGKWTDWKEDIEDEMVYKARISELRETYPPLPEDVEPRDQDVSWPAGVRAKWWLVRMEDGRKPILRSRVKEGEEEGDGMEQHREVVDERWAKVESLKEVENVYDLGFWENLKDSMFNRG
ncbi:DHHC palmitoyltransferase-domain-containing protein [Exophiala viscosa]|uniref:Palmitoyltransferase n=1 Tax=Exophiala viscosa TaxID=2486360 RepID=A0AAN6IBP6_9EURO|nr:DHHC palmitoyltransferase-domain-containing protein [Exophiala viscosa]